MSKNMPSRPKTVRETSAGGVVVRRYRGRWQVAVVEPNAINQHGGRPMGDRRIEKGQPRVLALPKGGINRGESPEQTAEREILEETGLQGDRVCKLGDVCYTYTRSWGGRERVAKTVAFYLLQYRRGLIGAITEEMRIEVRRCMWVDLSEAHAALTYTGEREMVKRAQEYLARKTTINGKTKSQPFTSSS